MRCYSAALPPRASVGVGQPLRIVVYVVYQGVGVGADCCDDASDRCNGRCNLRHAASQVANRVLLLLGGTDGADSRVGDAPASDSLLF